MKKAFLIISVLFLLNFIPNDIKAQYKVGCIVDISDSSLTHLHTGWTIAEYYKNSYDLPFDLEFNVKLMFDSIVSNRIDKVELVFLDSKEWRDYQINKRNLNRKEFKKYRFNWFENILKQDSIGAIIVIESVSPKLVSGMSGNVVETDDVAIATYNVSKKTNVYCRLQAKIFWNEKPQKIKTLVYHLNYDNLPMEKKNKSFTSIELLEFKKPLIEVTKMQLDAIINDPVFNGLVPILRRNELLKNRSGE